METEPQLCLKDLIDKTIEVKFGNDEFALFYLGPNHWRAGIGNPSCHVLLGEVAPELTADATTAIDAVRALLALVEDHKREFYDAAVEHLDPCILTSLLEQMEREAQ